MLPCLTHNTVYLLRLSHFRQQPEADMDPEVKRRRSSTFRCRITTCRSSSTSRTTTLPSTSSTRRDQQLLLSCLRTTDPSRRLIKRNRPCRSSKTRGNSSSRNLNQRRTPFHHHLLHLHPLLPPRSRLSLCSRTCLASPMAIDVKSLTHRRTLDLRQSLMDLDLPHPRKLAVI